MGSFFSRTAPKPSAPSAPTTFEDFQRLKRRYHATIDAIATEEQQLQNLEIEYNDVLARISDRLLIEGALSDLGGLNQMEQRREDHKFMSEEKLQTIAATNLRLAAQRNKTVKFEKALAEALKNVTVEEKDSWLLRREEAGDDSDESS